MEHWENEPKSEVNQRETMEAFRELWKTQLPPGTDMAAEKIARDPKTQERMKQLLRERGYDVK
jgi:hypothetical protein